MESATQKIRTHTSAHRAALSSARTQIEIEIMPSAADAPLAITIIVIAVIAARRCIVLMEPAADVEIAAADRARRRKLRI